MTAVAPNVPMWIPCARCGNTNRLLKIRKATSKDVGKQFYKCDKNKGGCGQYHVSPDLSTAVTNPDTLAGSADGPGSVSVAPMGYTPATPFDAVPVPAAISGRAVERAAFEGPPLPEFATTVPTQDLQFLYMVQEFQRATQGAIGAAVATGDVSSLKAPKK